MLLDVMEYAKFVVAVRIDTHTTLNTLHISPYYDLMLETASVYAGLVISLSI